MEFLDSELFEEFDFIFMKESDIAYTIPNHGETSETKSKGKT